MEGTAVEPQRKTRRVNLRPLKRFAAKLPPSSLLRELLLTEPEDELDAREFLGRVHVWLQLSHRPEFFGFGGRTLKSELGVTRPRGRGT